MNVFMLKPGDRDWISYPAQFAALSAFLKKNGHNIGFFDAALGMLTPSQAMEKTNLTGWDVLAISVYTGGQTWTRDFISLVRTKYSGIKIVVGGPHISSLEIPSVEHLDADIGVVGEGELPLAELLVRLEENRPFDDIPGLIWKDGGGFKNTLMLPRWRIKDLDSLPMPDYEFIPPDRYFDSFRGASVARKKERCAVIFSSRGCPYTCTFCATNCTWMRQIFAFSADRVIAEIVLLKEKYGIEEIWFIDDTFTFSRSRTVEICRQMIEKKLNIFWRLPNGIRIESIDDELMLMMRRAGCYMTGVGIETGSESAMKRIKKRLDIKIIREKIAILRRNRILVSGFFIYGFPWETLEQIQETENLIIDVPFDRMQISIFNPYPGSEEFDNIMNKKNPEIYAQNIRKYLFEGEIAPFLENIDLETLYKRSRNTYLKFYFKPRVLWSILTGLTWQQIKDIFRHPMFQNLFKKKHDFEDTYVKLK